MGNTQSADARKPITEKTGTEGDRVQPEEQNASSLEAQPSRLRPETALHLKQPEKELLLPETELPSTNESHSPDYVGIKRSRGVTLPPGLDAGDIVLFNRRCLAMAPLGALICAVAKAMSNSRWDHVGVVVRKEDGSLHLLEANLSGVTLRPLDERIRRSRSNEIAFRRLSIVRTERFRRELEHFAEQILETPYKNDFGAMLVSVIHPADMQERERLHALLVSRRAQRMEVERELREAVLTAFQRNSLMEQRRSLLQSEEKIEEVLRRELAAAKGGYFEGSNDLSRVFCSELVAAAYQRLGLLSSFPPADSYVPKDFSTEQTNPPGLHLLKNARLSKEEFIRRLPAQKQSWLSNLLGSKQNPVASKEQSSDLSTPETANGEDGDPATVPEKPRLGLGNVPDYPRGESRELIRDALKRTPIFAALSDEYARNHLVKSFRPVFIEAGDYVFHQGDYGDAFYVVERGSLDRYIAKDGQEPIHVSTLGPRNSFGLTALFFNAAGRSSTIRARERSLLWRLDRATFERFALDFGETSVIENAAESRQLRALLKKHFLFSRLDRIGPKELESFFMVKFRPGETIFEQGEKGDNFYIVKSGVLERWISKPGYQPKLAGTLQPGDSFGELSLMYNAPRGATVRARTDVELWAISAESFHRLHLGGGACYLERIFKEYASVKREKNHHSDDGDSFEYFMTPEDFLRFARADAFKDSPEEYRRLSNLLLRLVSNNNSGTAIEGDRSPKGNQSLIDFWEFVRFDLLLNQPDAESQLIFRLCDRDNTGQVGMQEFQEMFLEYANGDREIETLVEDGSPLLRQLFGKRGDRKLNFRDFTSATQGKLPEKFLTDIRRLKTHMQQQAARAPSSSDMDDEILLSSSSLLAGTPQFSGTPSPHRGILIGHVTGIALAGALARTVVAPLDRLKVLMQTESVIRKLHPEILPGEHIAAGMPSKRIYPNLWRGIRNMLAQDGLLGMYRGNGANALRIIPATIIQSATIALARESLDRVRDRTSQRPLRSTAWETVLIGGIGGILAATITYPLDMARARLTVQHRGPVERYRGILQCLREIKNREGVRALYRGLLPSNLGIFPYVGINFAVYETLRPIMPRRNDGSGRPTPGGIILSGFIASTLGQIAAYPFDTCRVRMQVDEGTAGRFGRVLYNVLKEEGLRALYRGLVPNTLKAWPTVAVSFYAYESLRGPLSQVFDYAFAPASNLKAAAAASESFGSR
jgi:solute carrier family 25 phosphate transporter 23/24/25/41